MKNLNLLNILESAIKEVYPDPNKVNNNNNNNVDQDSEPIDSSNLDAPTDDSNQLDDESPTDSLEGANGAPSDPNNPMEDDSGLEGGSGDIGGGLGGGGFGGGGGLGDIDGGQQPSEEDTGIDTVEDDTTEDPVKSIVDKVKLLANKTSDELMILRFLKAGVQQRFPNPKDAQEIINQLKKSGNATLANSADRLQNFLLLKQERKNVMKNKKRLENLNESELRAIIRKFVDKKFNKLVTEGEMSQIMAGMPSVSQKSSAGNSTFDAERSLGIKAKTLGLEFEKDMIKELDLVAPNQMDGNSQKIYKDTMDNFHDKFVAAVVDAVNAIKILPKNEHEEQKA